MPMRGGTGADVKLWHRRRPAQSGAEAESSSGHRGARTGSPAPLCGPGELARAAHAAHVASIHPADLWGRADIGPVAYRQSLDKALTEARNIVASVHGFGGCVPADWVDPA